MKLDMVVVDSKMVLKALTGMGQEGLRAKEATWELLLKVGSGL